MRAAVVRFLRWLAVKLGGESDLDLYARTLGMRRLPPVACTREALEEAIALSVPAHAALSFEWPDRNTLVVKFRGGA